jgi:hypothetical protein
MRWLRQFPAKMLWRVFYGVLVLSLILDVILLYFHIFHYHFSFQYIPQFFALFGLIGCILLILIAKGLGHLIVTDEDYYERRSRG